MMKVVLGADHRGFALKEDLKVFLTAQGHAVEDVGAHVLDKDDDYPDFAYAAALLVAQGKAERGILLCGSGMGMDIVANKVRGVRATIVRNTAEAQYARDHDDVNVITLAADSLGGDAARAAILTFIETPFSEAERHAQRLEKLRAIEDGDVFDQWCALKRKTHNFTDKHFFREGDVLFMRMGKNVGFEQDGKGYDFARPVLVVRKFNQDVFFGIALTTHQKKHPLYVSIGFIDGLENIAILSQCRLYDQRRAIRKIGHVPVAVLRAVRQALREALHL